MITDIISNAYKQAMLNKNEDRKRVINTLRAEIKNKEIELRSSQKELTDADVLSLIQKLIKQNKDAIQMFVDGGRQDLVERNEMETFQCRQGQSGRCNIFYIQNIRQISFNSTKYCSSIPDLDN